MTPRTRRLAFVTGPLASLLAAAAGTAAAGPTTRQAGLQLSLDVNARAGTYTLTLTNRSADPISVFDNLSPTGRYALRPYGPALVHIRDRDAKRDSPRVAGDWWTPAMLISSIIPLPIRLTSLAPGATLSATYPTAALLRGNPAWGSADTASAEWGHYKEFQLRWTACYGSPNLDRKVTVESDWVPLRP